MSLDYNKENIPFAKELRKRATPEENHLWYDFLSNYPLRFRRQKQFGRYIADFYCSAAKLIIELDGGQHYTEEGLEYDRERTAYLEGLDLRIVRFSNSDVDKNFRGVCAQIEALTKAFPFGEGGMAKP